MPPARPCATAYGDATEQWITVEGRTYRWSAPATPDVAFEGMLLEVGGPERYVVVVLQKNKPEEQAGRDGLSPVQNI